MTLKKYTVVGRYDETEESFTDHVEAFFPSHALEVVDMQRELGGQWEPCAIFEGHLVDHITEVESCRKAGGA